MENQEEEQVQAPIPPPARAAARRLITQEDLFRAYEFLDNYSTQRYGLPLPKKAPKIEATEFTYVKHRDDTGSELGNLYKRAVYQMEDLIGDKRREILHLLPVTKKNNGQVKQLRRQLDVMKFKLSKMIADMEKATNILLRMPFHFENFPELED